MEIEITIRAEEPELPEVREMLTVYEDEAEIESQEEEDEDEVSELSDERRTVLQAVNETPRSALRVVHRTATELDGSPFDDYDGWNDERERVRDHLWGLKGMGLVDNDGQQWYPTDQGNVTD